MLIFRPFGLGKSKIDYDNVLADSEREAVADLLNYLENVRYLTPSIPVSASCRVQRGDGNSV